MLAKKSKFEPATLKEIIRIVKSYGVKCSPEDPVPVSLLSSCIETFAPYWLDIVNLSFKIGDIKEVLFKLNFLGDMDGLKNAVLIPLIKEWNSTVDTEHCKNYLLVSNLLVYLVQVLPRLGGFNNNGLQLLSRKFNLDLIQILLSLVYLQ